MRILQVAPLMTPENAYGGPMTVALGQCRALLKRGHDVTLAAGARGYSLPPTHMGGVPVKLFRAHKPGGGKGFTGLISPELWRWAQRAVEADVVHIHLARDLLTLPVALSCAVRGIPFVIQTHGMVVESGHPLARPLDSLITSRVVSSAARVWYLTDAERTSLGRLFPAARLEHLRNGCDETDPVPVTQDMAGQVLFLARIQERKRPLDFVRMAADVAQEFPEVTFRMVGPDEGDGPALRSLISEEGIEGRLRWDGAAPPERVGQIMRESMLYVLPSVDEPYPMSVIEALSHGLPVIVTDTCGLAPLIEKAGAGVVIQPGAVELASAVRRLLRDVEERGRMGQQALHLAGADLSIDAVVDQLVDSYEAVAAEGRSRG